MSDLAPGAQPYYNVLCHELLHRKAPSHNRSWKLLMGIYLPDWRERHLAAWMLNERDNGSR